MANHFGLRAFPATFARIEAATPPHGRIAWPADTDKAGKAWRTPISPEVRARLLKALRERPGLGPAPLFPAPRNRNEPVDRDTLAHYLRQAERKAGVPTCHRTASTASAGSG